ncbi:hypothetical protein OROHE_011487 [Orobanche hederae]
MEIEIVWPRLHEAVLCSGEEDRESTGGRGRRRDRSRRPWEEQLRLDLKALNLSETMNVDMCSWRRQIRVVKFFLRSDSVVESLRIGGAVHGVNTSSVIAEFIESIVVKFTLGHGKSKAQEENGDEFQ